MRHGYLPGRRGSRRLAAVLAGSVATLLVLVAALSTGAANARTQTAPSNTALPAISGTAVTGQTLAASPGTWDGSTPITYAYQWLRCDSNGNNCSNISGETTNHRLLSSNDVGHELRVKVTATNSDGSAAATSNPTHDVVSSTGPPVNTAEPITSGTTVKGETLTTSNGTWIGATPITYTYKWLRCDTNGSNCALIAGETSANRQLVSDDVGHKLRSRVTATNSQGSDSADSNATNVITASGSGSGAPGNTALPSISGTATQGQTLTGSNGTWTGAATITYAYQWQRCDSAGNNCSSISGATTSTRTLTADDVGHRLRLKVTATNSQGSASATSNASNTVAAGSAGPPVNTALPTITGSAVQGQTLVASAGTWTGAATITFTYQWLRCDSSGNACNTISGETKVNRTIAGDDVGKTLRIRVTAKNSAGTTLVQSNPTAVITASSGGGGGPLPDGAVKLPSGKYSIPVTSVSLPAQLVIDKVKFSPNPVRSRTQPIIVRVHVVDTRGYVVRDALVFIRSVPLLTSTPPEAPTAQDGWVTLQILPKATFPLKNRHFVQFFARVRKNGDTALAGVGSRRLVQLRTARPA